MISNKTLQVTKLYK